MSHWRKEIKVAPQIIYHTGPLLMVEALGLIIHLVAHLHQGAAQIEPAFDAFDEFMGE
jgi:hypothetical protein